MISQNPAFQVLVVNDNAAALAAGNPVSALAIGQIGFFSYQTNLSVDGSNPALCRSFYIAVGVDPLATGSLADVVKSAGNSIQLGGIRAFTSKPYVAPVNKQIKLSVGAVTCNTEYGVRFEVRSEALAHTYGFNFPYKSFTGFTAACADQCVDCAAGDPNSLVYALGTNISLDPDGIFSISYTSPLTGHTLLNTPTQWELGYNGLTPSPAPTGTPTTGTGAMVAGTYYAEITATNADGESLPSPQSAGVVLASTGEIAWTWTAVTGATGYKIYVGTTVGSETSWFTSSTNSYTQTATAGTTGTPPNGTAAIVGNPNNGLTANMVINILPDALTIYSQINLKYADPRQVNVYMSLLTDPNSPNGFGTFGPDTTQSDLAEITYEDGAGYDIQELEYIAGGWNGNPGPYRVSELNSTVRGNIQYYSSVSGTYQVFGITNDNSGIGGGAVNRSSMATYIAVPSANTTALNSINATLHRILGDAPAADNDSTVNGLFPVATAYNSGVLIGS